MVNPAGLRTSTCVWSAASRRGSRVGSFAEADQVRQQLVCAVGARGQLAPESQTEINPAALAVARFDERARFRTLVVRERIGEREEIVTLEAGVCLTIPRGTHFQFRTLGDAPLAAVGVTMPPWPGEGEAVVVAGPWAPTVP